MTKEVSNRGMVEGKIFGEEKFKELKFQDFGRIIYVYIETAQL